MQVAGSPSYSGGNWEGNWSPEVRNQPGQNSEVLFEKKNRAGGKKKKTENLVVEFNNRLDILEKKISELEDRLEGGI